MDRLCLTSASRPQSGQPVSRSTSALAPSRKRPHSDDSPDAATGVSYVSEHMSSDDEHDVMCFWSYAQQRSKRRRALSDGACVNGGAEVAEAKGRLYLTSAPDAAGATRIISLPRAVMHERFAQSPLAVVAAHPPQAPDARDLRIGANDPTRHVWPTTLSHRALGYLKTMMTQQSICRVPPEPLKELLLFADQHLLEGLPRQLARRLGRQLSASTVATYFALAHSYLHVDSEGAFADLAHACHRFFIAAFEDVCDTRSFQTMSPQVQADLLASVMPTLNAHFAQKGYEEIAQLQPAVLYALRQLSGVSHAGVSTPPSLAPSMNLAELLYAAIAYEMPDILEALQDCVSRHTYARLLSANGARALHAAASFDCEMTLQSVLSDVDDACIRACLSRDDYAAVMSVAQCGRTQSLETLVAYLSERQTKMLCNDIKYLPSALGCQRNLHLFDWLTDRVGTQVLGAMLRDVHCSALLTAIRHNSDGIVAAYVTCALGGLGFSDSQASIKRVLHIALNRHQPIVVVDVLARLSSEEMRQVVVADEAWLLCRMLASGDASIIEATWKSFSSLLQNMCLISYARELCAAAVEGECDTLSLRLFRHVSNALMHLNAEHPFAVAMQNQRFKLAAEMFDTLTEAQRRLWASDPEMRAIRLAAQSGALDLVDRLIAQAPGAMFQLAQNNPHIDHRLLKAMVHAPVGQALVPVFEANCAAWRQTQLRHDHFRLIAFAIEVGSADCLQYMLSELSEHDRQMCLARLVPEYLPAVLRDGDAGVSHTLAQAAPTLWTAVLRREHWALMQRMLRINAPMLTNLLKDLPKDALDALWAAHGPMMMAAGLSNRRLGGYLIDRFAQAQRQAILIADDARLLHQAFELDEADADILLHLLELTAAQQRQIATQMQCRMLHRRPNVTYDADVFALFAQHLTADEVMALLTGPSSAGLDAQLTACPLAFEAQMQQMSDEQRTVVVEHLATLLRAWGPADG